MSTLNASVGPSEPLDGRISEGTVTVDDAFKLAGGHGKYQKLAALAAIVTFMSNMLYVFSIPFFVAEPDMECFDPTTGAWADCGFDDVCDHNPPVQYRYLHRYQNFVTEYDLVCEPGKRQAFSMLFFVGTILSCLCFSTFGDVHGRLPLLLMGQIGNIIGLVIMGSFSDFRVCLAASCGIGVLIGINQATPFNFVYDSMESKYGTIQASILNACWASGEVLIALIMWNKPPWRVMIMIIILFSAIFIVLMFWIREAPRFHYSKGQLEKTLQGLRYIGRMNGHPLPPGLQLDRSALKIVTGEKVSSIRVLRSLLCSKKLLFRVFLVCLNFFCSMSVYYGISVNLEKFGGNMVVNGVLNAVAEIVGVTLGNLMLDRVGKKPSLMLMFITAGAGLFAEGLFEKRILFASISMYIAKCGSAGGDNLIYVFAGEIFPTAVKNMGLSLGILSCSMGSLFGSVIGLLPYFALFCVMSGIALIAAGLALLYPVQANAECLDTVEQLENS